MNVAELKEFLKDKDDNLVVKVYVPDSETACNIIRPLHAAEYRAVQVYTIDGDYRNKYILLGTLNVKYQR